MKYAVFRVGGNQYKAEEKEELLIDKLEGKPGEKLEIEDVLLLVENGDVKVGTPKVKGGRVIGKIVEHTRGKKLRVFKYKAKARYRRTRGHRPSFTKIKVEKISSK